MEDYTDSLEYMDFVSRFLFDVEQAPELSPEAVAQAAFVGSKCAELRNESFKMKSLYKRAESEVLIETVDHYKATGEKPNLDYIKAKVAVHPKVVMLEDRYVAAEEAYQTWKAEFEGLMDRSMTMKVLVAYQKKQATLGV